MLVDRKLTTRHDLAIQVMKQLPYNRWREYDPEDTLRFYALRLREAGMITSNPQKLVAQSADWRACFVAASIAAAVGAAVVYRFRGTLTAAEPVAA